MTLLTLVRHGTTEWMEAKKLHGITDSPLSEMGKREAALTGQFLSKRHFDVFYTSPLGRAVETAAIISEHVGLAPQKLDGLIERDFGMMEGRPHFGEVKVPALLKPVYLALMAALISFTGEKRDRFKQRLFETGCSIASQHPDQNVLAVVHTAVQSHLINVLADKRPNAWMKYNNWSPCAITEIEISPQGEGRLVRFNANDHTVLAAMNSNIETGA
jgi:broad specificity phosphatase PhoE